MAREFFFTMNFMKKFFALTLIVLSVLACKKDKEEEIIDATVEVVSDLSHYALNGSVKSIEEKSFEIVDGRTLGNLKRESYSEYDFVLEFNEKGQLVREKKFNSSGQLQEENRYDGKDKLLETIQYMNNAVFMTTKYTRDDFGNIIIMTRRNADQSQFDKTVQGFIDGKIVQKRNFDANERLMSKITYEYNEKGNLVKENYFKNTESITNSITYDYDDDQNKITENYYDSQNKLVAYTKFGYLGSLLISVDNYLNSGELQYAELKMYDDQNNLTYNKVVDNSIKSISEEKMSYDSQQNMISYEVIQNGVTVQTMTKGYDDAYRLAENVINTKGMTTQRSYRYDVDDKGNWTKKTIYIDKVPVYEIQRVILYY